MRMFFGLMVVFGLALTLGCGNNDKVIPPSNVPPKPSGPPGADSNNKGDQAPPPPKL